MKGIADALIQERSCKQNYGVQEIAALTSLDELRSAPALQSLLRPDAPSSLSNSRRHHVLAADVAPCFWQQLSGIAELSVLTSARTCDCSLFVRRLPGSGVVAGYEPGTSTAVGEQK